MNYVYCPCLDLHGLTSITPFFKQCRFSNISFDMELKVGTLFLLVD